MYIDLFRKNYIKLTQSTERDSVKKKLAILSLVFVCLSLFL